jgi:hypothetical protein
MRDDTHLTKQAVEEYEPPAIVSLGSIGELTLGVPDESSLTVPSDRALKEGIEPVTRPLERLRAIDCRADPR